jgi:hypothetical protein
MRWMGPMGRFFGSKNNIDRGSFGGQVTKEQNLEATDAHTQDGNYMGKQKIPPLAYMLAVVASMGGFIFGYESGEISGMGL